MNDTRIKVIGIGGAGCNAVANLSSSEHFKKHISKHRTSLPTRQPVQLYAANSDWQALEQCPVENKITLGAEGRGAGGNPAAGEECAMTSIKKVNVCVSNCDFVFLTVGLGGGTGTGAAPVFARAAKEKGAFVVAVVTMPFAFEGDKRNKNAEVGLENLKKYADTVISVSNDKITERLGRIPLRKSFEEADSTLADGVFSIINIIESNGLIDVDTADIQTVLRLSQEAYIGLGTASGDNAAEDAAAIALESPLIEKNIRGAKGAIINITGGGNMTIADAERAVEVIKNYTGHRTDIIFGAVIDPSLKDTVMVNVIIAGIEKSLFFRANQHKMS